MLAAAVLLLCGLCVFALETDFRRMQIIAGERFGESAIQAIREWEGFLNALADAPLSVSLKRVNEFVNLRTRYVEDREFWNDVDYWATPLETLGRGGGDCEDFALIKYLTLRLLKVPSESLRLTYVRAQIPDVKPARYRAHMVLSYYPDKNSEPLILDSLISEILPASQRPDLKPVFSFNNESLWVTGRPDLVTAPTDRLSHWRDVLARMRKEGVTW